MRVSLPTCARALLGLALSSSPAALAQTTAPETPGEAQEAPAKSSELTPAGDGSSAGAGNAADPTERGTVAYRQGVELTKQGRWAEAIRAFEEAATWRESPLLDYNLGYCQRALGQYVRAERTFSGISAEAMPPEYRDELSAYLTELRALLSRVQVTLEPASAQLSVDGRPLLRAASGSSLPAFVAGVSEPSATTSPGVREFELVLDPGTHVIKAERPGHAPVLKRVGVLPGERASLDLRLDALPAVVLVESNPAGAIVLVDGREAGLSPLTLERAAGTYRLEINRDGYEPYAASLQLTPGQQTGLSAELTVYEAPLTHKWWFWTGIGTVLAAGALTTYFLTRPEPEPPPYETGNTGWLVPARF